MMSDYDVTADKNGKFEFYVKFHGPSESEFLFASALCAQLNHVCGSSL